MKYYFEFSEMWSPQWNDIDRGKPKNSEKNLSQCHFAHHKSHLIDLGAKPGRRGERPATNRLSHGTALTSWHTSTAAGNPPITVTLTILTSVKRH
jgi:hypothetical protein